MSIELVSLAIYWVVFPFLFQISALWLNSPFYTEGLDGERYYFDSFKKIFSLKEFFFIRFLVIPMFYLIIFISAIAFATILINLYTIYT
jgi:hypothetical protein